jgi:hypothetical protein
MKIIGLLDYWRFGVEFQFSSLSVWSCCGWGAGTIRRPREGGTSAIGGRYQRTGEETEYWEG